MKLKLIEGYCLTFLLVTFLFIDFVCSWKYVYAVTITEEKFYLVTLILSVMMTIIYTIWFFEEVWKKN